VIDLCVDPATGQPIRVRIGRFGPFLQRGEGGAGNTASLPDDIPPADLTCERAVSLLEAKAAGPRELGVDPASGLKVYLATGRFGPYVQLGETPEKPAKAARGTKAAKAAPAEKPRRASLPKGVSEAQVTLEQALRWLSLPRDLGTHPETGQSIAASVGRFGPYVKHGDEFRSLAPDDDVYTITLDRAVALLKEPKGARRRQAAKVVLRALGPRPDTQAEVTLFDGRYGPYVSDGTTNASLPKTISPDAITLAEAVELLNQRAAAGPKKKGGARRAGGARKRAAAGVS
jgi:DNA topoisomerase-1